MKEYEAQMTLFRKDNTCYNVRIEGYRTKLTQAINELLKQNEDINNIQVIIREKL